MADSVSPLMIYADWFNSLPQVWAEQVASFAFHTIRHYQPLQHYCLNAENRPFIFDSEGEGYTLWLFFLIRDHSCHGDPYAIQELAVLLHCSTHMVIEDSRKIQYTQTESVKAAYIKSLLCGDANLAAYLENKLQEPDEQQVVTSWQQISKLGFSFNAIHHYLVQSVSGK
jgi:hypothetical protein